MICEAHQTENLPTTRRGAIRGNLLAEVEGWNGVIALIDLMSES
ncbi:MAG: hypothetical protein WAN34_07195 [Acidimicrobiia bacterium]